MTYRTPRVLHWLAEGRWYWIHTADYRMNDRACGFEWMTAPVLLFTRSDRFLFLLNFIPFLLLPGLIFSVLTRLGVRGRVAWQWMWLLPTGYTFLVQASSLGNDTFPTVFALAAVDFACRAWVSRQPSDLWLSILAAAFMTGAKASNLPLLLSWAILSFALLPLLVRGARRLAVTVVVFLMGATASFLPMAVLNTIYCGDWSGAVLEEPTMTLKHPLIGLWGNGFQLALGNLAPTFFPFAKWWNNSWSSILPRSLVDPLVKNFNGGIQVIGEVPTEDWAGLGCGVTVLAGLAVLGSFRYRRAVLAKRRGLTALNAEQVTQEELVGVSGSGQGAAQNRSWGARLGLSGSGSAAAVQTDWPQPPAIPTAVRRGALVAPWIALVFYCVNSGMDTAARLLSPYYPLLLPSLLVGIGQAEVIRRRWWRVMVCCVLGLAFPVVILEPGHPLWPAQTILGRLAAAHPGNRMVARALDVYRVYENRSDPLAQVRALLPNDLDVVGFMGGPDDIAISFWRPFGRRRVEHIMPDDSAEQIRQRHIRYAVAAGTDLDYRRVSLEAWEQQAKATLVQTVLATTVVKEGPQPWYMVRFDD